jgi:hypothetical protein
MKRFSPREKLLWAAMGNIAEINKKTAIFRAFKEKIPI